MATVTCVTEGNKNKYSCTGTAGGCARAIAKLKTIDVADAPIPELGELRILTTLPQRGDTVRVGLQSFSVEQYDIIVHELGDGRVAVAVFDGDQIVFRGDRPTSLVKYVPGDGSGPLPFRETLNEEDFVRVDIQDLKDRRVV